MQVRLGNAAGANNGYLKLWVNGVLADTIADVDNNTLVIASEYLAVRQFPSRVSGVLYFDAFESRRGGYIGPLTLHPSGGAKLAAMAQPAA